MIRRLRVKFVCINMIIVTIMLGIVFGMVLHFTGNSMKMESLRMMQAAAAGRGRHPGPRQPFLTVHVSRNGDIESYSGEDFDLTEEEISELVELSMDGEEFGKIKQYDLRYLCMPGPDGLRVVFGDTSVERSMLTNLVRDCLIIGAVSLVIFFFISMLLAKWAVKPVERSWTQQRQFVADASHELKTPLTVILTNAELLQSPEYDGEQKEGFTKSILTMSHQMRGLVESLLKLARVDAGQVSINKNRVDLRTVVDETVLSFEVMFFEKELTLKSELQEDMIVLGSESHLRQVVEILLDNALKYSLPGQTEVCLNKQGHQAVLTVSNPGDPIAQEDLENIFKRFYRVDTARSMNQSYGLGLSIAEGIVKDHNGKISAESKNGMNTFLVSIPLIK